MHSPDTRGIVQSTEEGAMPLAYLATEPDADIEHGSYWHRMRVRSIRHPQWGDVQLRSAVKQAIEAFDSAIVWRGQSR